MKDHRPHPSDLTGEAKLAAERGHARKHGLAIATDLFAGSPCSKLTITATPPPAGAMPGPRVSTDAPLRGNPLRPLASPDALRAQLAFELDRHAAGDITMAGRLADTYAALAEQSNAAELADLRRAVFTVILGVDPGADDPTSEREPVGNRPFP